jgi:16S rRNA (cytosine1402-N4)-methyltransferase
MDRGRGPTACEWLRSIDEETLTRVLQTSGEQPQAPRLARAICDWIGSFPPDGTPTTLGLSRIVLGALGVRGGGRQASPFDLHPAARTFQAIRMAVNREMENLDQLLRDLPYLLRPGGRAAIIAFHSGEEARVKRALWDGLAMGLFAEGCQDPIRPSTEEIRSNPRSRSAHLYWVERAR